MRLVHVNRLKAYYERGVDVCVAVSEEVREQTKDFRVDVPVKLTNSHVLADPTSEVSSFPAISTGCYGAARGIKDAVRRRATTLYSARA